MKYKIGQVVWALHYLCLDAEHPGRATDWIPIQHVVRGRWLECEDKYHIGVAWCGVQVLGRILPWASVVNWRPSTDFFPTKAEADKEMLRRGDPDMWLLTHSNSKVRDCG